MANLKSLSYHLLLALAVLGGLALSQAAVTAPEAWSSESSMQVELCRPIDSCRGKVANEACCKAISGSIATQGCSCICWYLKAYDASTLAADCYRNSMCNRCNLCTCTNELIISKSQDF